MQVLVILVSEDDFPKDLRLEGKLMIVQRFINHIKWCTAMLLKPQKIVRWTDDNMHVELGSYVSLLESTRMCSLLRCQSTSIVSRDSVDW